jgi:hypothetical protein
MPESEVPAIYDFDEQRVRTMCGWIGVEIAKSRVRTPGKAGYGLYRVRGFALLFRHGEGVRCAAYIGDHRCIRKADGHDAHTLEFGVMPWTGYQFELDVIEAQVRQAIARGKPARPADLYLPKSQVTPGERPAVWVPTRWTPAYRGRRDLGVSENAGLCAAPWAHDDCTHG